MPHAPFLTCVLINGAQIFFVSVFINGTHEEFLNLCMQESDGRIMLRILIVDDDIQIRDMLRQMLEREGFEVADAPDGGKAVKSQRSHPADLVITDILMPGKEGLETIRVFRQDFPDVKIIAMSGGGQAGPDIYLKMARKFGAAHTFTKPVDRYDLLKAVHQALR